MGRRPARAGGRTVEAFGELLKRLRGSTPLAALSDQMAKVGAPLSTSTLSRYETDGRVPDVLGLYGLAAVHALDAVSLFRAALHNVKNRNATVDEIEAIATARAGGKPIAPVAGHVAPADLARLLKERNADLAHARERERRLVANIVDLGDRASKLAAAAHDGLKLAGGQAAAQGAPGRSVPDHG